MQKALVDQLIRQALASREREALNTYALVDCARDPEIYEALIEPELEVRCLFSGDLPEGLVRVAPHLVALSEESAFARSFREAWGKSWGLLARSSADIETLRKHFKKMQVVLGPERKKLLFRYYDPRVLRAFLPSCDRAQLEQVFGPVKEYLVEAPEGGALAFRLEGGALRVSTNSP